MVPIAEYSRDLLRELRAKAGVAYDERPLGLLQLFRHQKQLNGTGKDIAILKRFGVAYELLDADGCVRAEPALRLVREKSVGGLRLLGDETGATASSSPTRSQPCAASSALSSAPAPRWTRS